MTTTWSPAPYLATQNWVLEDGTIVTSPPLETTSSGRRVRAVGSTDSVGSRQVNALIQVAIDKVATDRNTTRLARVYDESECDAMVGSLIGKDKIFSTPLTLHMLDKSHRNGGNGSTTAIWKFQIPGIPVFAYFVATLNQGYNDRFSITHRMYWRNLSASYQSELNFVQLSEGGMTAGEFYSYSNVMRETHDFIAKNPILMDIDLDMKDKVYNTQMRTAVVRFAEWCKKFDDEVENIQLPLLTGITDSDNNDFNIIKAKLKASHKVFKRTGSNYSGDFHQELLSFVQTEPVLDRLQANYKQMIADFRTLGLVVKGDIGSSEFVQALNGDLTQINVSLEPNEDSDEMHQDGVDHRHTVSFDFATGTVVVNCTNSLNAEEATQAFEVAKFKAEMTGELDVLLEYARAYQRPKEQKRLMKIIEQRTLTAE